jgi:hypothetical protein
MHRPINIKLISYSQNMSPFCFQPEDKSHVFSGMTMEPVLHTNTHCLKQITDRLADGRLEILTCKRNATEEDILPSYYTSQHAHSLATGTLIGKLRNKYCRFLQKRSATTELMTTNTEGYEGLIQTLPSSLLEPRTATSSAFSHSMPQYRHQLSLMSAAAVTPALLLNGCLLLYESSGITDFIVLKERRVCVCFELGNLAPEMHKILTNRFRNFDDNGMDRTQTLGCSSAGTPIKI